MELLADLFSPPDGRLGPGGQKHTNTNNETINQDAGRGYKGWEKYEIQATSADRGE